MTADIETAAKRFGLIRKLYVPSAVVAAVAAATISFVDGYGNGQHPKQMPWYSLGWDVLYYVERAFVLYMLIVLAILVATSAFVGSRWRAAYDEYAGSGAVQPEEPRRQSISGDGDGREPNEGDQVESPPSS
jgi:hypothetical protein